MRGALVWTLALAIASLAPSALSAPFRTHDVFLEGDSSVSGSAGLVFVLADDQRFSFTATAAGGIIERKWADCAVVATGPGYQHCMAPERSRDPFAAVAIESTTVDWQGAMLVRADTGVLDVTSVETLVVAQAENAPRVDQNGRRTDVNSGEESDADYTIHDALSGNWINATVEAGTLRIVGNVEITLFGVDYSVDGGSGASKETTGISESGPAGPLSDARYSRHERHVIKLTGADLVIQTSSPATILAQRVTVAADGPLVARGVETMQVEGRPIGRATGALSIVDAGTILEVVADGNALALTASAPATLASVPSGAPVQSAFPGWAAWVAAAVIAIPLLAAYALRRRPRLDPLEAAVLAMEEKRWSAAVRHLDRALAKRPDDAKLLVDRALCLEQAGRLRDAANAYERALRQAPDHAEAHFYYARTLARMHRPDVSEVHLATALQLDPRLRELRVA